MNCEDYRAILSAEIHPKDAAKRIGQYFIVQMSSVPNHTAKAAQAFLISKKYCEVLYSSSRSPDLKLIEHAFHSLKTELKLERSVGQLLE